ncbi:CRISPR system precrRNA processing endoribonuclease RAMP protein Cas6 [Pyrodictium abyssi]|uniref:CRISPR system precrRNA processing endoribonuclease RAMP protein Cas6 n=1 Tax=Pyrodictium abyssi TaxID=54256 RepID=A0ABM8IZP1_9CREN|nr:CRISPR system precrRNA processing endoribonuclease RAMP protein Cas6 [Pyrodictium abyssi]
MGVLRLRVVPLRDLVLPPVSSKLVKSLLVGPRAPEWLRGLVEARRGYKPLFVSMLYRGRRPLYSTTESPAPLAARAGEQLGARVAFVAGDASAVWEAAAALSGRAETPYGPVEVVVEEASVAEPGQLRLPSPGGSPTGVLRLEARTPVVLTSKTLVASEPPPGARVPRLHRLLPAPGLVAAYALRLWNRALGPGHAVYWRDAWNHDAALVARAAEVYMAELDYRVHPETVIIGRGATGRLRLARGWRGWITYRVAGPRLARLLDRLLALTNTLGLGRSRGIGLGDTHAQWIRPKQTEQVNPQPKTTQKP